MILSKVKMKDKRNTGTAHSLPPPPAEMGDVFTDSVVSLPICLLGDLCRLGAGKRETREQPKATISTQPSAGLLLFSHLPRDRQRRRLPLQTGLLFMDVKTTPTALYMKLPVSGSSPVSFFFVCFVSFSIFFSFDWSVVKRFFFFGLSRDVTRIEIMEHLQRKTTEKTTVSFAVCLELFRVVCCSPVSFKSCTT